MSKYALRKVYEVHVYGRANQLIVAATLQEAIEFAVEREQYCKRVISAKEILECVYVIKESE